MGKFLERLRRGKEKLRSSLAASKAKREIRAAITEQKRKGQREKRERREKIESTLANLASKREEKEMEKREIQREKAFEQRADKIARKEKVIAKVRESQLKRAKIEAGIFKARAQRATAVRTIRGPLPTLRVQGPIIQPRSSITGFGPTKQTKKQKKKRPMGFSQQPTPGLGRFRVL